MTIQSGPADNRFQTMTNQTIPSPASSQLELSSWHQLTPLQQKTAYSLRISQQQIEYAGTVANTISLLEQHPENNVLGVVILAGSQVAGLFLLKRRNMTPHWVNVGAAVITALRIDEALQGKGLATAALQLLPQWLAGHWPDIHQLVLSVDEENHAAIRAYNKAGFIDQGKREMGRIGWVRYMSRQLDQYTSASPHYQTNSL